MGKPVSENEESNIGSDYFSTKAFYAAMAATILVGAFVLPGSVNMESAEAYSLTTCKWAGTDPVITYKLDSSVTSAYAAQIRHSIAMWNDAGAKFRLDEITSGTPNINVYKESNNSNHANDLGWVDNITCTNNAYNSGMKVHFNSYAIGTGSQEKQRIQWTAVHEFGHALGLNHFGTNTVMRNGFNGLVAPTLDDIRGLMTSSGTNFKYGQRTSSSICYEWGLNGDVIFPNGCTPSSTNQIQMKVINPIDNGRASVTTNLNTVSLPSNGALLMTAKVKATTLNKFSMGVYTNNNIADTANRVMSIEIDSDGFWLVWSPASGSTPNKIKLTSTLPVTGQVYYIELVVKNGEKSWAYVYKDNGSPTSEPTAIATATLDTYSGTVLKPWTTAYYGMGVWMPLSTQPRPDYTVSEYYNLLKSYT